MNKTSISIAILLVALSPVSAQAMQRGTVRAATAATATAASQLPTRVVAAARAATTTTHTLASGQGARCDQLKLLEDRVRNLEQAMRENKEREELTDKTMYAISAGLLSFSVGAAIAYSL